MMKFELSITGWTTQVGGLQLPICKIVSPIQIDARAESVLYASQSINCVKTLQGDYAISGILWSDARIYAKIRGIDVILTNGNTCIWCFCYSRFTSFSIDGRSVHLERGMHYGVAMLEEVKPIMIEEVTE